MPPRLTARQLFITGVVLTMLSAALSLVADGWLGLDLHAVSIPLVILGTIPLLLREMTMTLGLVLIGAGFLARTLGAPR